MARVSSVQRQLATAGLIVLGFISLHALGALQPIERVLVAATSPMTRLIDRAVRAIVPASDLSPDELQTRVTELERLLAEISVENVDLRTTLEATGQIVEQRAFLSSRRLEGVSGRIVARSADPSIRTIRVDVGSESRVAIDAPVIIANGVLIGRVVEVSPTTSTILLTTDARSSVAATISDNALAEGVVNGDRGLALTMELIPQNHLVSPGAIVMTSGTEPSVPRGIVIGLVERVDRFEGALFQSAQLRPLYAAPQLDGVTIIQRAP